VILHAYLEEFGDIIPEGIPLTDQPWTTAVITNWAVLVETCL